MRPTTGRGIRPAGLRRRDEAISAVLSTAIMVGVAIALAVAVFFFVHILSKSPRDAPPNFAMNYDDGLDQMQFVRSTNTYDLSSLRIAMSADGHYGFNGPASLASPALGAGTGAMLAAAPGTAFAPGDTLRFCTDTPATGVAVTLVHPESDTLLLRHTFDSLQACA